ncbi:MAG: actinorhodin polyketide synthase [Actinobacteria bacterium 13_2_20CM_2_71_6]|nr:MAG: actinorhodin polyketide synthase [Actinobacteria bacterium 13_2_20CM_2_71_6]
MQQLTIEELKATLLECAGTDEAVDFDGDILDTPFSDLGYDSLALLETTGRIARIRGVRLSDDIVVTAKTPRELIDLVNAAFTDTTAVAA